MGMKITVITSDRVHAARVPFEGADHVLADDVCHGRIKGSNPRDTGHDTMESDAHCVCGEHVGFIRIKISTIFGLKEDRAVLEHSRARVY